MPPGGRKRKSWRQNAGPRVLHDTCCLLRPCKSSKDVCAGCRPARKERKRDLVGAPSREETMVQDTECGQEFYTTPAACCVHANPEPCLSEVVQSEQAEPVHVSAFAGNNSVRCIECGQHCLFRPCKSCTNGLWGASVHRWRGVHLSIAGAGCSCRSRAWAAPLRSRIAAVPSTAAPGHAATRACCSNASAGTLRKPLVQDLHGLNSTARDSCNPRPQWSPGPRSTDAPRARDGRMHHAPAMDGCTMRLRWTAAPRARDRRSQCPPCARRDVW